MNQVNPAEQGNKGSRQFILEMLGFSDAERAMIASTFRLTGRRDFTYVEPSGEDQRADIYLINADNPQALRAMQSHAPNGYSPAVIVGRVPLSAGWPFVKKPIQWMRLFEHLDELMAAALLERSRREQNAEEHWDGQTLRRSVDKHAPPPAPVFLAPKPTETVLVVDDSATVRAFMRMKLAPFKFDVDFAENGQQAIDMAQAKSYTCIFLDIMMPGIDGYEVCKRIKANAGTKDTAVVMLTSKSGMFDKLRGNWAGCDAYLSKPVPEDELLATIAKFLPSARS